VDLSWIDADVHRDGDQHFRFAEAFTGRAGQAVLTYDAARDRTLLQLDVDGDARADFVLHIDGHAGPDAGWVL
jgi:serralysin